jgi:hypothetical protein
MGWRAVGSLAFVSLAGACDVFGPTACTDEARPGLEVTVVDSATGAAIASVVRIVARSTALTDSIERSSPNGVHYLLHEAPGVFDVTVSSDGKRPWQRGGITVVDESNACRHVRLTRLTARLQPS